MNIEYFGIDWLAMVLTFIAIYLLGNKSRYGFVIMMGGNSCWTVIGLLANSYAMVIANIVFFIMNTRGYIRWKKTNGA